MMIFAGYVLKNLAVRRKMPTFAPVNNFLIRNEMKKMLFVGAMMAACLLGTQSVSAQDVVSVDDAKNMTSKELSKAAKVQKQKEKAVKDAAKAEANVAKLEKKVAAANKAVESANKKAENARKAAEKAEKKAAELKNDLEEAKKKAAEARTIANSPLTK